MPSYGKDYKQEENFYKILGVSSNCDVKEINKKFKELALLLHPDKSTSPDSTPTMQQLSLAYETLKDPDKRLKHDQFLADRAENFCKEVLMLKFREPLSQCFKRSAILVDSSSEVKAPSEMFTEAMAVWNKTVCGLQKSLHFSTLTTPSFMPADDAPQYFQKLLCAIESGNYAALYEAYEQWPDALWFSACTKFLEKFPTRDDEAAFIETKLSKPYQASLFLLQSGLAHIAVGDQNLHTQRTALLRIHQAAWTGANMYREAHSGFVCLASFAVQLTIELLERGVTPIGADIECLLPTIQVPKVPVLINVYQRTASGQSDVECSGLRIPSSIMRFKYENSLLKKIQTGQMSSEEAAYAYINLAEGCESTAEKLVCYVVSAKWFLKSYHESSAEVSKNCLLFMLKKAKLLAFDSAVHTYLQLYVASQGCACLQDLSKAETGSMNKDQIEQSTAYFEWYADCVPLCPFPQTPNLLVCDAALFDNFGAELLFSYLTMMQTIPENKRPVDSATLFYTLFYIQKYSNSKALFPKAIHRISMDYILKSHGLGWNQLENLLRSDAYHFDEEEGWLLRSNQLFGKFLLDRIISFDGFEISKTTGQISLFLTYADSVHSAPSLLTFEDIAVALLMNEKAHLSLDPFDKNLFGYPFVKLRYGPEIIGKGEFLHSLLLADFLLKQFATGVEVSFKAPFNTRPMMAGGLWRGVPVELQRALKPPKHDGLWRPWRYWFQCKNIEHNDYQDASVWRCLFGKVTMAVNTAPQEFDIMGRIIDSKVLEPNSSRRKFAKAFTDNFDAMSEWFPVFKRLKELSKLQFLGSYVSGMMNWSKEKPVIQTNITQVVQAAQNLLTKQTQEVPELVTHGYGLHYSANGAATWVCGGVSLLGTRVPSPSLCKGPLSCNVVLHSNFFNNISQCGPPNLSFSIPFLDYYGNGINGNQHTGAAVSQSSTPVCSVQKYYSSTVSALFAPVQHDSSTLFCGSLLTTVNYSSHEPEHSIQGYRDHLSKTEGFSPTKPYIPTAGSGATIGHGLDLGQQNRRGLVKLLVANGELEQDANNIVHHFEIFIGHKCPDRQVLLYQECKANAKNDQTWTKNVSFNAEQQFRSQGSVEKLGYHLKTEKINGVYYKFLQDSKNEFVEFDENLVRKMDDAYIAASDIKKAELYGICMNQHGKHGIADLHHWAGAGGLLKDMANGKLSPKGVNHVGRILKTQQATNEDFIQAVKATIKDYEDLKQEKNEWKINHLKKTMAEIQK